MSRVNPERTCCPGNCTKASMPEHFHHLRGLQQLTFQGDQQDQQGERSGQWRWFNSLVLPHGEKPLLSPADVECSSPSPKISELLRVGPPKQLVAFLRVMPIYGSYPPSSLINAWVPNSDTNSSTNITGRRPSDMERTWNIICSFITKGCLRISKGFWPLFHEPLCVHQVLSSFPSCSRFP